MSYAVKEIYYTLQGEGYHTGRPAVFLRFAGCNLWSGREEDRADAVCRFCDTDFFGTDGPNGGRYGPSDLSRTVEKLWSAGVQDRQANRRFVVCTGGEPLLQLDAPLIAALHSEGFEIAVETNGTLVPPPDLDWICVSPKAHAELVVDRADELKLVYPQPGAEPERYADGDFSHFYLQPMDGDEIRANTAAAIEYCLHYPRWKLSLQTHKLLGIP
jgi:7-carboxy-7-deazaguanine synthase (Cx14CxxC type)